MNTQSGNGVLCAGRLYCDLVFTGVPHMPRLGEETFAQGLAAHAGGGAFITAATIRALGWQASVFATLPEAPFDQVVAQDMAAADLSADLCKRAQPGLGPQLTVATVLDGDRAFLTHNAGSALPEPSLPKGQWRHLHIGELRTLVDHPALLNQARAHKMSVSVDCGWDDTLVHDGSRVSELLAEVDVFLPNNREFEALTASGYRENAVHVVVVKRGAEGASALHDGRWLHKAALPTDVLDTTGAGDAFNGGFLVAWLRGDSLSTCLAAGNHCGAVSVKSVGGTGGLAQLCTNT